MNGADEQTVAVVGVSRRSPGERGFDGASFGFSPREAESLGPEHRAFLQSAREALEDAGGAPGEACGVYASGGSEATGSGAQPELEAGRFHGMLGGDADYLATRVSFKLGLTGPSLSVTGGAAAPLAAVHLACESLLAGEIDTALAGGAEGAVALKRLEDAVAGGCSIRAVIRGSAIRHDGALAGVERTDRWLPGAARGLPAAEGLAGLLQVIGGFSRGRSAAPRWAVSAASAGGLNACVVLEEPPRERRR